MKIEERITRIKEIKYRLESRGIYYLEREKLEKELKELKVELEKEEREQREKSIKLSEQLKSFDEIKKEKQMKKVYGYRRCLFCKETIFTGEAFRRKYGKRKRYFDGKNCLIEYILDRINIEMDLKDWTLMLSIKDYWDRPKIKEAVDRCINRNYEKVFVQNLKGEN